MKKAAWRLLYYFLSVCSSRLNSKLLIRFKMIVGSSLLLLNHGYAQSKQKEPSKDIPPVRQDTVQSKEDSSQFFCYVMETMPEFPGGQRELLNYLMKEISKYPPSDSWVDGRMALSFVIDTVGKVSDPEVLRSLSPEQDSIGIEIIRNMPDWSPGKLRGKPTRIKYTVPLTFKDFKKAKE